MALAALMLPLAPLASLVLRLLVPRLLPLAPRLLLPATILGIREWCLPPLAVCLKALDTQLPLPSRL